MVETIFSSALGQAALVFVLIFTVVFAILQKTKILGDNKKQIDALVALAAGLLVISVGYAINLISSLIPFLAVSLVIILVFLLLLGIFYKQDSFEVPGWMKAAFGVVAFIAVVIAVLYNTDAWAYIQDLSYGGGSNVLTNVIVIIVVLVILAVVVGTSGGKDKKD